MFQDADGSLSIWKVVACVFIGTGLFYAVVWVVLRDTEQKHQAWVDSLSDEEYLEFRDCSMRYGVMDCENWARRYPPRHRGIPPGWGGDEP